MSPLKTCFYVALAALSVLFVSCTGKAGVDISTCIPPGTDEICGDGIDQDCSGSDLECPLPGECDADNDGFDSNSLECAGNDCNDLNFNINPDISETCGNGIDEDCSGSDLACSSCTIDFAVPSTGCSCDGTDRYSGYCCSTGWQATSCSSIPSDIIAITASGMGDDSLLGIPRRKMVQKNNQIWIFTAGGGSDAHYSSDGGLSWAGIQFFSVGDHDSFDIDASGNIHTGQRQSDGISTYKRVNSPGTQLADYNAANDETFTHFSVGETTASAVLAHNSNVFMFTRASFVTTIYYDASTDIGLTWSSGGVLASSLSTGNRVGGTVIDDTPYAIIWEQMSSGADRITFYGWTGSSFLLDSSLTLTLEVINPLTRVFSITQTDDGNVHVAYWNNGSGNRIRHTYKKRTDASWVTPVTVDDCNSDGLVSITAHGNNIYAAYLRPSGGYNAATYKKFDGTTKTWGERVILDALGDCRYPAFPKKVIAAANYVPLAWTRGTGLYYFRILSD